MTKKSLVPEGISHDFDLSKLSYPERMEHHRKQLWSITRWDGINAANAYKEKYPEAKAIWIEANPTASIPKPPGYDRAIIGMVSMWFESSIALAAKNREDVERLNRKLETNRFDPDRLFNRPLSQGLRKKIAAIFEGRHLRLPASAQTLSAVRKAVVAAKAQGTPQGRPFTNVGTRTPQTLVIGAKSFPIEMYKGRECIRVSAGGTRQRVSMAILETILAGLDVPVVPGDTPPITIYGNKRELVSATDTAPMETNSPGDIEGLPADMEASSPGDIEAAAAVDEPAPSLYDRIARLAAANRAAQIIPTDDGSDPLELQP
jgi:hypothetical protein